MSTNSTPTSVRFRPDIIAKWHLFGAKPRNNGLVVNLAAEVLLQCIEAGAAIHWGMDENQKPRATLVAPPSDKPLDGKQIAACLLECFRQQVVPRSAHAPPARSQGRRQAS
jgi:hypothetical protein